MQTILHIIRKEFLQLRRDPRMFPILFLAPIAQFIFLGYAANLDVKSIPFVVHDQDRTKTSRDFITQYANSEYFSLVDNCDYMDQVDDWIDQSKANLAILIPRGFEQDLLSGETTELQIISDGAEANSATIGLNYAGMIALRYSQQIILKKLQRIGYSRTTAIDFQPRIWYNPELKSRYFMIPGILALLLMVMTMILTSLGIVKEKEIGTMEQLIVTPIKSYQLILGKLFPFVIIGVIDIIMVVTLSILWFDIAIKGSIILLFLLSFAFLLTTLGLGLFISTISRTQQQAMMTSIFFFMMPMMFFSGFIFPIENMPKIIQGISYLLPLRYYFVIIRGIYLKGAGILELWDETGALLLFGLMIMTLSIIKFHKKLD
ncbi:MAG: ABC transporter permease [Candidatus Delongbacteria bacterium]|nr:ABC transporter permease [Candidatus Delongbacteria bacterium]